MLRRRRRGIRVIFDRPRLVSIHPCGGYSRSGIRTDRHGVASQRTGRTMLVVDDEPGILDLIHRVLRHAGYNVITSRSGDDAWEVIERSQPELDLVLTDIVMPGSMDGFTLADNASRKFPQLPVLLMTGAVPENDHKAAAMAGKRLLLRKPFSTKALVEFIDSHLGES
jgi:CheY-like chemotaxis protein